MRRLPPATLLLATALATPAGAQTPNVVAGIKGGLTVSDLALEDAQGTSAAARGAFAGGVFLGIRIVGAVTLQPEMLFNRKGAEANDNGVPVRFTIDYLEIPLLARFTVPAGGGFRPLLYFGPSLALELRCRVDTVDLGDDPINDPQAIPVTANCDAAGQPRRRVDAGLLGGAGLDLDLGPFVLSIEGRYTLGLVNIDAMGVPGESIRNRSASGLVGVGVPLR